MSVALQIFYQERALTPEQGRVFLDMMVREIDKNPQHAAPSAVKIPGVSRYDNPFPEWLQQIFEGWGLSYNSINLCYAGMFKEETAASRWMKWFDETVRPWLQQVRPEFDPSKLQVRAMTEDETIMGAESF